MSIKEYFKASMWRAVPYVVYLLFFFVMLLQFSFAASRVDGATTAVIAVFLLGAAGLAVVAGWRFAMAFQPTGRVHRPEQFRGYFPEEAHLPKAASLAERLISYQARLRHLVVTQLRGRRRLTVSGLSVALLLLLVPVTTWAVILFQAFEQQEELPNAWLLVVSSTSAGALGLAIAVSMLRHVKNSQVVLSSLEARLLDSMEASLVVESPDLAQEQRERALAIFLSDLCRRRGLHVAADDGQAEQVERDFLLGVATQGVGRAMS